MKILNVCCRILDLEKTASPAPWFFDCGNGEIECHNKKFWRLPVVQRVDLMDRVRHCKEFEITAYPGYTDFECEYIVEIRNHIKALCEALKEAHEALSFYGSLSKPSGKHACDVDVRFQIEGPTIANEWLKKWGTE